MTKPKQPKLLPCPFCGSEKNTVLGGPNFFWVMCDKMICNVFGAVRKNKSAAIKAWNKRKVK